MRKFINKLETYEPLINPKNMPNIDLYMDQVIQIFENQYKSYSRKETDKVMKKAMINNYSKEKLYDPIKNKKYNKNHLMLLSMIYQLKNTLCINDIKKVTRNLSANESKVPRSLEHFYEQLYDIDCFTFSLMKKNMILLEERVKNLDFLDEKSKKIFYINVLSQMSAYNKYLAEKLVDEIEDVEDLSNLADDL